MFNFKTTFVCVCERVCVYVCVSVTCQDFYCKACHIQRVTFEMILKLLNVIFGAEDPELSALMPKESKLE